MGMQQKGGLRGPEVLFSSVARASDIRDSGSIEVLGAGDWSGDVITRKGYGSVDFDNGISLHFAREVHLAHLETAATLRPCLSVKLFLEGAVRAEIGDHPLPMPQRMAGGGWKAAGVIVAHRAPARFRRLGGKGCHLVKVIVDVPHDWLEQRVQADRTSYLRRFLDADLAVVPWQPGPADIANAQRLFASADEDDDGLTEVHMEAAALAMVASSLRALKDPVSLPPKGPRSADPRMVRFLTLVAELTDGPVDVAELCQDLGVSSSTLQRLCRQAFGCSVQVYIRTCRLQAARAELARGHDSLSRIAWRAGYGSAANFATAFGRAFGCRPSDIRRGNMAQAEQ